MEFGCRSNNAEAGGGCWARMLAVAFSATNSVALAFSGLYSLIKSNPSKIDKIPYLQQYNQVAKSYTLNRYKKVANFFSGIQDSRDRNPNFTVGELRFRIPIKRSVVEITNFLSFQVGLYPAGCT